MPTAFALGNATLSEHPPESGAFRQSPHQQQITVGVIGAEPLPVFLKQAFPGSVVARAMQMLNPLPNLRQPRLQQAQGIAG